MHTTIRRPEAARSSTGTSSSSPTRTAARCTASAARCPTRGPTCPRRSTARKGTSNGQSGGHGGRNPYEQEHVALFEAIRKNHKHNDGWYGATSSFTAVLGRMATYSGQTVKWDEAVAHGPSEMPKRYALDADPPALPDKDGRYPIPVPGIYRAY